MSHTMLFIALFRRKAGTPQEATARRAQWRHPAGITPVAEYRTESSGAVVASILQADNNGPVVAMSADWGAIFDIDVHPTVTAEQGLQMAQQMMAGLRGFPAQGLQGGFGIYLSVRGCVG